MRKTTTGRIPADPRRVKTPRSAVVLWRPRIVVAPTLEGATTQRCPLAPEALASPAAGAVWLGTTASLLGSLAEARASLTKAAVAHARAAGAESTRERVIAAMTAYRLEASVDQTLAGTYRQVTELLEERGLA